MQDKEGLLMIFQYVICNCIGNGLPAIGFQSAGLTAAIGFQSARTH